MEVLTGFMVDIVVQDLKKNNSIALDLNFWPENNDFCLYPPPAMWMSSCLTGIRTNNNAVKRLTEKNSE